MIDEIAIQNLGTIKSAKLNLTPGLNIITGETGAGKTMILTALHLLMGKRSDSGMVRHGASEASAEGVWLIDEDSPLVETVEDAGGMLDEGQLFINRSLKADGKSRAVLGGRSVPAGTLSAMSPQLVSIHGQADQIRLKDELSQLAALDDFGRDELKAALAAYEKAYKSWRALAKELKLLTEQADQRRYEYDHLANFMEAFNELEPEPGEIEELESAIQPLEHLDDLREGAGQVLAMLAPEDYEAAPPDEAIRSALKLIKRLAEHDSTLEPLVEQAEVALDALGEITDRLQNYQESLDEESLATLYSSQERLIDLQNFVRKQGMPLDELVAKADAAQARMDELDPEKHNVENLRIEVAAAEKVLTKAGDGLTLKRMAVANRLETAVNGELAGLAMAGNKLVINISKIAPTARGIDRVEFLLKSPGGGAPRPIARAASGGELSRIMLALEVVLADPEKTPTFVFDEVDSGVGGSTAIEIGRRLARLAEEAQVVVVTHLPQVACFASNHLKVTKTVKDETMTTVASLSRDERVRELARMLSGLEGSNHGEAHAEELLVMAGH